MDQYQEYFSQNLKNQVFLRTYISKFENNEMKYSFIKGGSLIELIYKLQGENGSLKFHLCLHILCESSGWKLIKFVAIHLVGIDNIWKVPVNGTLSLILTLSKLQTEQNSSKLNLTVRPVLVLLRMPFYQNNSPITRTPKYLNVSAQVCFYILENIL